MNTRDNEPGMRRESDDIGLVHLLLSLWAQRGLIATITLICSLSTGVFYFGALIFNHKQSLTKVVMFDFQGIEKGQYPDGTHFSIAELKSNDILNDLAAESEGKFSATQLERSIEVVESSAINDSLLKRLSEIPSDRLQPKELVAKTEQLIDTVVLESKKFATIIVNLDRLGLTETEGSILINKLLAHWSKRVVEQLGVLTVNIPIIKQDFIWDKNLSAPVNIDALDIHLKQIEEGLNQMLSIPGIDTTSVGGVGIADLLSNVSILRGDILNPLKTFVYQNYGSVTQNSPYARIELESRTRSIVKRLEAQKSLLAEYDKILNATFQSDSPAQSVTNTTDISGSFVNEMLKLGEKLSDKDIKSALLPKRIKLIESISGLEEVLSGMSSTNANYNVDVEQAVNHTQTVFSLAISKYNTIRGQANDLLLAASTRLYGIDRDIYHIIGSPHSNFVVSALKKNLLVIAIATIFGFMLAVLVAIIRSAILSYKHLSLVQK